MRIQHGGLSEAASLSAFHAVWWRNVPADHAWGTLERCQLKSGAIRGCPAGREYRYGMAVDAIASGGALAERILDALDLAVLGLSIDRRILFMNAKARAVVDNRLLPLLKDVIRSSHVRRSNGRRPVPVRVAIGGHETYVYAARAQGDPPLDVIFMRDAPRDADLFRLLNEKYGVTRRGYQVLARLRLGRTNRQIAAELMLTPGTVTQLVHDLLGRFQVPNRTSLVSIVEQTGMGAVWEPSR